MCLQLDPRLVSLFGNNRTGSKSKATSNLPFREFRKRRGAAAVEFAIVAPIFLLLLAGVIEFGQAFRIQHTLSTACRRGARAAVLPGATNAQVTSNIQNQCVQMLKVNAADVSVNFLVNNVAGADVSGASKGDQVEVKVSIPFSKAGVGFFSHTFSTAILSASSIFEHE